MALTTKFELNKPGLLRRFRWEIIWVVASIVVVFCVFAIIYSTFKIDNELKNRVKNLSGIAQASLANVLWNVDKETIYSIGNSLSQEKGVAFFIVREKNNVYYEKKADEYKNKDFNFFKNSSQFVTETRDIYHGKKVGVIQLAISKEAYRKEMWINIFTIIGLAILIITAISLNLIRTTQRHIFQPLQKLEKSAVEIAGGNLEARIDTSSKDEIGNLACAFDEMKHSVKSLIGELRHKNRDLDELNKTLGRRVQERTGELERAINEEKKAKDIAEKANKAKDQFLAKVSHDIRTPMNSINGFIKLLLQSELKPEQTEYLNIVNSSAHYLIGIINDILNFSKMESGQFEIRRSNFQLKKILNDIKNNFTQPANEKNIQFEIALLSNVPTSLYGDDIRLEQILNNLVGNAIRYTQEGKVRVEVSCIDKKSDNATILFKVSDTGKGIPREDRQRIFLPYEQLDKNKTVDSRNGVGLGLTISQQLVNKMGGKIEVESEPGKGSKFFFSIPFEIHSNIVNDSTTKSIETKLIDLSILKKRHVLVVEDDRASQFLLKIILENAEISVDCANDGREAMEKIFRTPYDIILMDMGLPEISGPEVIIKVRQEKRFEKLPIIAVTADAIVGNQQIYLDAGADDCLLKPIDTEILLSALVKWIEKGERV